MNDNGDYTLTVCGTLSREAGMSLIPIEELAYVFHSVGGGMKCPTCSENTPDAWQPLRADVSQPGVDGFGFLKGPVDTAEMVAVDYMHCANPKCSSAKSGKNQSTLPLTFTH